MKEEKGQAKIEVNKTKKVQTIDNQLFEPF